jgi:hypothetical protein
MGGNGNHVKQNKPDSETQVLTFRFKNREKDLNVPGGYLAGERQERGKGVNMIKGHYTDI